MPIGDAIMHNDFRSFDSVRSSRRSFLHAAGLALGAAAIERSALVRAVASTRGGKKERPNIVFIMADDHAAHAIGAYDSRVNRTPNIDRLAREGMMLRSTFATNSICTPSRAAILTGQYSHINGVTMFNRFDSSRQTVARLLQAGGYYTGMIGKWHLGSDPVGFDHWEILPGQGEYFDPVLYTASGETKYTGRYVTDVITDLAIEFIRTRPADRPFFVMVHHKAPHRPWIPDEVHRAMFANTRIAEPPTLRDNYAGRTDALHENRQRVFADLTRNDLKIPPPSGLDDAARNHWLHSVPDTVVVPSTAHSDTLTGEALNSWKYQRYMQDYLATIQSVDDNVGRLLDTLDAEDLTRDTMVIYTSDQGFFLGDHGLYDKRFMYEESLRMPFLVRWPAGIKPGTISDVLTLNVDFAPTFLDAAGLRVPESMQGRSFLSVLRGRRPAHWRTSMYYRYYHDPGHHNTRAHYGVRTRSHKLIYFWKKDQWELYDLIADPHELTNLYGLPAYARITRTLKAELHRLREQLHDTDQFANEQFPGGVDGSPTDLRGK
jgi:arylsulfatase A-like enzyme